VVEHEGDRELDERDAGMLGELGQLLDASSFRWLSGWERSKRSGSRLARDEDCWPVSLRQRPDSQPPVSGL